MESLLKRQCQVPVSDTTRTGHKAALHLLEEKQMFPLVKRFYRHDSGATATEYAMLVVFIALAVAVGAQALGIGLSNLLNNIASTVTNVQIPSP
jgi:pilus assembly protein Flp/PilA